MFYGSTNPNRNMILIFSQALFIDNDKKYWKFNIY